MFRKAKNKGKVVIVSQSTPHPGHGRTLLTRACTLGFAFGTFALGDLSFAPALALVPPFSPPKSDAHDPEKAGVCVCVCLRKIPTGLNQNVVQTLSGISRLEPHETIGLIFPHATRGVDTNDNPTLSIDQWILGLFPQVVRFWPTFVFELITKRWDEGNLCAPDIETLARKQNLAERYVEELQHTGALSRGDPG